MPYICVVSHFWTRIFLNASGSGKTRILLEGLLKHWGLYLVCAKSRAASVGLRDLPDMIEKLPHWAGFNQHYAPSNEVIAQRTLVRIFASRLYILSEYLALWQDRGGKDEALVRQYWVLAQVQTTNDMFKTLATRLKDFSNNFVSELLEGSARSIRKTVTNKSVFIVIDEAQSAAAALSGAFQSKKLPEATRPVLSEILRECIPVQEALGSSRTTVIISGTGINYDTIVSVVESNITKSTGLNVTTFTGRFDRETQGAYIRKYLFAETTHSPDLQMKVIERAWRLLSGRSVSSSW